MTTLTPQEAKNRASVRRILGANLFIRGLLDKYTNEQCIEAFDTVAASILLVMRADGAWLPGDAVTSKMVSAAFESNAGNVIRHDPQMHAALTAALNARKS